MTEESRSKLELLALRRSELLVSLGDKPSGLSWCHEHTEIADEAMRILLSDLQAAFRGLPSLAVIATGGYGRRELAPYSDIDVTVVPSDEASNELDPAIRALYQDLHVAFVGILGLQIGYSYRLVADAPGLDTKTRTGLMDMRLVAGSPGIMRSLDLAVMETLAAGQFVLSKMQERTRMFEKFHDTPYVVEPNLKEGAGGLRCFHCGNWIREAIGERAVRPLPAYDEIIRYRNLLHLQAGRNQDTLTRPRQAELADRLGVDMYEMMSEVVAAGEQLFGFYGRSIDKLQEERFRLSSSVLSSQGEARISGDADGGDAAVGIAVATALKIGVSDIPASRPHRVEGPAVMYALSTGEATIRNLNRSGLLDFLLPELAVCRTLMPTDAVHQYTVYEHTLRVVRALDEIGTQGFFAEVKSQITDLEPLYLAAILHDVGKIDHERPHSEVGAEITRSVCERWQLAGNIKELVIWLDREHLSMSRFIRDRDIRDPNTIKEFIEIVDDPQRLHALTLLTFADISAVSDSSWTPALETFLRDLYHRTLAVLDQNAPIDADPGLQRKRLLRQLKNQVEDVELVQGFVNSLPAYYLTSTPSEVIRLHMEFAELAARGEPTIDIFPRQDLGATDITVCAQDRPRLLSHLLGILYAFDLSIIGIRACTTSSTPAIVIDVFTVGFGNRPVPAATLNHVRAAIADVLEGDRDVAGIMRQKGKDPDRKQQVFSYSFVEGTLGILEIRAPRGRGMPYRFSRLLAEQGWDVVSARVGQWAGNAAAAFSITGPGARALTREEVRIALSNVAPTADAKSPDEMAQVTPERA
jgi:[protein-PII] uridylyltransferase